MCFTGSYGTGTTNILATSHQHGYQESKSAWQNPVGHGVRWWGHPIVKSDPQTTDLLPRNQLVYTGHTQGHDTDYLSLSSLSQGGKHLV